ncbi:hypothetical protein HC864_04825 [Candidatus Gracilibacteria bacterium]|nr:hypothetical protein [Candidatus Gracilibacteria bacterium]
MNSKYVIGFGTLVVILIGFVAYVGISNNNSSTNPNSTDNSTQNPTNSDQNSTTSNNEINNQNDNEPKTETISSSFKELALLEQNYQCTFSNFQNGVSNNGTIYKSGPKLRTQYTDNSQSTKGAEINMIRDSQKTHVWFGDVGYVYNNSFIDNNSIPSQDTNVEPINSNSTLILIVYLQTQNLIYLIYQVE